MYAVPDVGYPSIPANIQRQGSEGWLLNKACLRTGIYHGNHHSRSAAVHAPGIDLGQERERALLRHTRILSQDHHFKHCGRRCHSVLTDKEYLDVQDNGKAQGWNCIHFLDRRDVGLPIRFNSLIDFCSGLVASCFGTYLFLSLGGMIQTDPTCG